MKNCYPISVLNAIKQVPEVCNVFCATANPTTVLIYEVSNDIEIGRGIIGVIDGVASKGVETGQNKEERKEFLRKIGYKR